VIGRGVFAWALLAAALAGCAHRYRVEGLVTAVDAAGGTVTVSHREIAGRMPAMMMPFRVANAADLGRLRAGMRVQFDLRGSSTAHHIRVLSAGQDVALKPAPERIAPGQPVPDFELVRATATGAGEAFHLSALRGKVVAIDFIYTRCPLPDVCPRLSAGFAYVAKTLKRTDYELVSITVDPEFDTTDVLAGYARRWHADAARWSFLTGPADRVREVAGRFGLLYWAEENMIAHGVLTAVIDRQGRLAAMIEGSRYRPQELRDLIERTLSAAPQIE
jgi:protein SCO1/2